MEQIQPEQNNTASFSRSMLLLVKINQTLHGEIEAISLVLQQLIYRLQAFEKLVILMDSKAAIQAASSNNQPKSKKINNIKEALKHRQASKKIVKFQWVPSLLGLEGKNTSDKLAKKGTILHTIEIAK